MFFLSYFNAASSVRAFFSSISAFRGMEGIVSAVSCQNLVKESGANIPHSFLHVGGSSPTAGDPIFITFHICAHARGTTLLILYPPPPKAIHLPSQCSWAI